MLVGLGVGESYHPMAARGDVFRWLRFAGLPLSLLAALAFLLMWFRQKSLSNRAYKSGLLIVAVAVVLPMLPKIDNGYRQGYWLDETLYEIPWQYGPRNGSEVPGGKRFAAEISYPDLTPRYETKDDTITIAKAVEFNPMSDAALTEKPCTTDRYRFSCVWRSGDAVYSASGNIGLLPSDEAAFMRSLEEVLDGFAVPDD